MEHFAERGAEIYRNDKVIGKDTHPQTVDKR